MTLSQDGSKLNFIENVTDANFCPILEVILDIVSVSNISSIKCKTDINPVLQMCNNPTRVTDHYNGYMHSRFVQI